MVVDLPNWKKKKPSQAHHPIVWGLEHLKIMACIEPRQPVVQLPSRLRRSEEGPVVPGLVLNWGKMLYEEFSVSVGPFLRCKIMMFKHMLAGSCRVHMWLSTEVSDSFHKILTTFHLKLFVAIVVDSFCIYMFIVSLHVLIIFAIYIYISLSPKHASGHFWPKYQILQHLNRPPCAQRRNGGEDATQATSLGNLSAAELWLAESETPWGLVVEEFVLLNEGGYRLRFFKWDGLWKRFGPLLRANRRCSKPLQWQIENNLPISLIPNLAPTYPGFIPGSLMKLVVLRCL